jgi:hypothetical protein
LKISTIHDWKTGSGTRAKIDSKFHIVIFPSIGANINICTGFSHPYAEDKIHQIQYGNQQKHSINNGTKV